MRYVALCIGDAGWIKVKVTDEVTPVINPATAAYYRPTSPPQQTEKLVIIVAINIIISNHDNSYLLL